MEELRSLWKMVAVDTEQVGLNSPANTRTNNSNNNIPHPSIGRQSSIYSLTLDEFQNTLCENGKNFGSMNMDEFLNSIWTAEENQNHSQNDAVSAAAAHALAGLNPQAPSAAGRGSGMARQPSLSRQGSLSLPAPLCRKTVEEVWSEIQRGRHPRQGGSHGGPNQASGPSEEPAQQRQQTFGEMTLEDFLVKAGVVREAGLVPPPPPPPPPTGRQVAAPAAAAAAQFGMYQNGGNQSQIGHTFGPAPVPVMSIPGGYPAMPQNGGGGGGEASAYVTPGPAGSTKRNNGYVPVGPPAGVCYGGAGVGNGGGYGAAALGMASPASPLGSEGLVDGAGGQYGMDAGALRARKRTLDGPVEKVVERRQRRMIKNRESAARSRARKQAYTVELEAELNQLRDENAQLKQALAEIERQRNQQCVEEEEQQKTHPQGGGHKAQDRARLMQRSMSSPL